MRKSLPFHVQLRYERERRGWSQADVASKVGSDPKTVGRWEQGKTLPRPYHRQALCALFEKNAEEFGLVPEQGVIIPPALLETDTLPLSSAREAPSTISSPPDSKARTYQNIINLPPPTSPRTIQQREKDVQTIYAQLLQSDTTVVVLTGMGGVGKSTLAALVYHYALEHYQAGESPFAAHPLWLAINENVTMIDLLGTLLETLGKSFPDLERLPSYSHAMTLFHALNAANDARLIVLDQFENVLDWQTGQALPERPGVGEWLDVLNSQPCSCKLLLTSRLWPKGTREYPSTYMQEHPVAGLAEADGIDLLRKQGVRVAQASDTQLQTVVARCDGHAFALTLLASLLDRNRSLNLTLLFENALYQQLWNGDIAHNLLDYIYIQQLNDVQREVLFAFSIYRQPVPLEACLALTNFHAEEQKARVLSALRVLLAQHLLQDLGDGLYQLHMIVATYVREYYVHEHKEQALRSAYARAANYYLNQPLVSSRADEQRRGINDVRPLVEAVWYLCQAELWQEAFDLMQREGMYLNLRRWGGNATLLELYHLLLPLEKWHPSQAQEAEICDHLGRIYGTLGKKALSLEYYERALHIYREVENRQGEGRTLNHIASVQENLGRATLARELHEQALAIVRASGDRKGEADSLSGLAWIAYSHGQQAEAIRYYEQALRIYQETGNRIGEGDVLNGMGLIRQKLDEKQEALQLIEQALRLRQEIGDRAGEARTLNNLGLIYADLEQEAQAYRCYTQSFVLRKETGDRNGEGVVLYNVGKLYFKQNRYSLALACWLQARRVFEEVRSTHRDAAQKWIDTLEKAIGHTEFIAMLAEMEQQPPQFIEQIVQKGLDPS